MNNGGKGKLNNHIKNNDYTSFLGEGCIFIRGGVGLTSYITYICRTKP